MTKIVGQIKTKGFQVGNRLFRKLFKLSPEWGGYVRQDEKAALEVNLWVEGKPGDTADALLNMLKSEERGILECEISILENEEEAYQIKTEEEGISLIWII